MSDILENIEMEQLEEEHDGTAITVTNLKISASEKVSTGDYENYNPHATMEAQVVSTKSWEEQRDDIEEAVLDMHHTLQDSLKQACWNKIAGPGEADWPGDDQ